MIGIEGLDSYLDEFEDSNIDNRRQIRENIKQISQRVDNLNNPIQILRNQNRKLIKN